MDEVVAPDMVFALGAQSKCRSVIQPQSPSFGLFLGHLQPFASPDSLDPLAAQRPAIRVIHSPALMAEQGCHPAIAIAPVPMGESDNALRQRCFVVSDNKPTSLGGTRLADHSASPALRHMQLRLHVLDRFPALRRRNAREDRSDRGLRSFPS
jgi:hypothetical protein